MSYISRSERIREKLVKDGVQKAIHANHFELRVMGNTQISKEDYFVHDGNIIAIPHKIHEQAYLVEPSVLDSVCAAELEKINRQRSLISNLYQTTNGKAKTYRFEHQASTEEFILLFPDVVPGSLVYY